MLQFAVKKISGSGANEIKSCNLKGATNIKNDPVCKTLTTGSDSPVDIQQLYIMEISNNIIYPSRNISEVIPSIQSRIETGKQQRAHSPRESHESMPEKEGRADPIQLLIDSNESRMEQLVPIRYGRMLASPFAFLRGSALVMAEDLSNVPASGVFVQCCGDCHLMNFGGYATPERNLVFDINDFDETLPAPFEWDIKRLAASIVVAGRYKQFSDRENKKAAFSAVMSYTNRIREISMMRQLEIWYNRIDEQSVIGLFIKDKELAKRVKTIGEKAKRRTHEFVYPKISEVIDGKRRILDDPPLIFHLEDTKERIQASIEFFDAYFQSLSDDKKMLLSRYQLEDVAMKVVGVGSVGTRCFIGLFGASDNDAIILQFKQGYPSVLEKYTAPSVYKNHGERIVNGQRLMQTVSDIFLGWTTTKKGYDEYVRQLRDMKTSANIDHFTPKILKEYAILCGWALAKSHAKAGMAPEITGYIGTSEIFADAVSRFAIQYADQTDDDFALLKKAEKEKRINVLYESDARKIQVAG